MDRHLFVLSDGGRATLLLLLVLGPVRIAAAQCDAGVRKLIAASQFSEARGVVLPALHATPGNDSLIHCMGEISAYAGDTDDAVRWFERAIAANDANAVHHAGLGNALAQSISKVSKFRLPFVARRMRGEFERAIALDPSLIDGHEGMLGYYLQAPSLFGGSVEKARAEAGEIGRLNAMRGHMDLAAVLAKEKDSVGAERELRTATRVALPDSSAAVVALGSFYVGEKRWSDAFDVFDRELALHPAAIGLRLQYGRVAALAGENLERGEREIKQWMSDASAGASAASRAGAHYWLGMIDERQNRPALARAEFEATLAIVPDHAGAKKALQALR